MNTFRQIAKITLAAIILFEIPIFDVYAIDYSNNIPQATLDFCSIAYKEVEAGNVHRQGDLAYCYENGYWVAVNLKKAAELWEQAATWNVDAQAHLGLMYERGKGVEKNSSKAVFWYQKAAALGYGPGQVYLGLMYAKGDGITKDINKANEWLNKAKDQEVKNYTKPNGDTFRAFILDPDKELEWKMREANEGGAISQLRLGEILNQKGASIFTNEGGNNNAKVAERAQDLYSSARPPPPTWCAT